MQPSNILLQRGVKGWYLSVLAHYGIIFLGNNEISPLCKEWGNPLFIFGI